MSNDDYLKDPTARHWCVITGDIVASTELSKPEREHLHQMMRQAGDLAREHFADAMPLPVGIFGGDSWQMLLSEPARALRAALLYRTSIMAHVLPEARDPVDTRCVVARAPIDFVPRDAVSEGEGEAFQLSGRELQRLPDDRRLMFVTTSRTSQADWDIAFRLIDELARAWTALQARAVLGALRGLTQEQTAELWSPPIRQASVAKHLDAAHWKAIRDAVEAFESRFA